MGSYTSARTVDSKQTLNCDGRELVCKDPRALDLDLSWGLRGQRVTKALRPQQAGSDMLTGRDL